MTRSSLTQGQKEINTVLPYCRALAIQWVFLIIFLTLTSLFEYQEKAFKLPKSTQENITDAFYRYIVYTGKKRMNSIQTWHLILGGPHALGLLHLPAPDTGEPLLQLLHAGKVFHVLHCPPLIHCPTSLLLLSCSSSYLFTASSLRSIAQAFGPVSIDYSLVAQSEFCMEICLLIWSILDCSFSLSSKISATLPKHSLCSYIDGSTSIIGALLLYSLEHFLGLQLKLNFRLKGRHCLTLQLQTKHYFFKEEIQKIFNIVINCLRL